MRIRWQGVGKVAIVVIVGFLALQALPALLKPPEPPPLEADVGLPRFEAQTGAEPAPEGRAAPTRQRERRPARKRHRPPPSHPASPAQPSPGPSPSAPPPAPAPSPTPPPEPAAAPSPPPAVAAGSAPGDGSIEFAPH